MKKSFLIGLLACCLNFSARAEDFKFLQQWQLGVGPAVTWGLNTPYMITGWRFGYSVQFDPRFDLALIAHWAISNTNTDMHFFTASVASNYYFNDRRIAPFVTVDAGYGTTHAHWNCLSAACESPSDDASGMELGIGGGYKFFRGSPVNMTLLGRYSALLASTRYGAPSTIMFLAIVAY